MFFPTWVHKWHFRLLIKSGLARLDIPAFVIIVVFSPVVHELRPLLVLTPRLTQLSRLCMVPLLLAFFPLLSFTFAPPWYFSRSSNGHPTTRCSYGGAGACGHTFPPQFPVFFVGRRMAQDGSSMEIIKGEHKRGRSV